MKKNILAFVALVLILLPAQSEAAFTAKQVMATELPSILFGGNGQNIGFDTDLSFVGNQKNTKNQILSEDSAKVKVKFDRQTVANDESVAISLTVPEVRENGKNMTNIFDGNLLTRKSGDLYFKVNTIGQEWLDDIGSKDPAPWLGRWVHISLGKMADSLDLDRELTEFQSQFDSAALGLKYKAAVLRYGQPLTIVSSGKIIKNSAGQSVQTIRVRLNSSWFALFQNLALEEYKKSYPKATAKQISNYKKTITSDLQEVRAELAKTQIDLTVNLTTGNLAGLKVVYSSKKPTYDYDYKYVGKVYKEFKTISGSKTEAFTTTVTFRPVHTENLTEPVGALTWEEFTALIMPESKPPAYDADHDGYLDIPLPEAPKLSDVVKKIGLNYDQFRSCVQTQKYLSKVAKDEAEAQATGGQGTPHSIVIGPNGDTTPIAGAYPFAVVDGLVKRSLGKTVANAAELPQKQNLSVRPALSTEQIKGNPNGTVTIVVFADLECPFCKQFNETLKLVIDSNPEVKIVYRHFPLDGLHKNARTEALGAECAAEQGKYWDYIDTLYSATPSNDGMDVTL